MDRPVYQQQYANEPNRNNYNKPPTPSRAYQDPPNHSANHMSPYQQSPAPASYQSSPYSYNSPSSTAAPVNNRNPSRSSMHAPDEPTSNTPGVIGAQEVYRDPRSRIEARQQAQKPKVEGAEDRMSFRDKMKMFASEAGESTPVQKPKASKSQRALEESLSYSGGGGQYRNNYSNGSYN